MIDVIRYILPVMAPLPVSLLLLLAGLGFFIFKKRKAAMVCFSFGIGVLLVFGYGVFTKPALYRLERSHLPFNEGQIPRMVRQQIGYVVVLGSGHVSDPGLPRTAQIGGSSLYRLVEGIRIYRSLPGTKLVISGGVIPDPVTNARVVGDVAQQIGIPVQDTLVDERPRDTLEEARLLQALLGDKPFILVTSAAHMKRAVGIFQDLGMRPMPAPTDYLLKKRRDGDVESWVPSCGNLYISQRVIYEWLGEAWRWIRGGVRH